MQDGYIKSLAINSNADLFAGTVLAGVFRSTDDGNDWTPVNHGLPTTAVLSLAVHPNGSILVGTSSELVYRSVDNGESWSAVRLSGALFSSFVFNQEGDIFAAGNCGDGTWFDGPCSGGGVYCSTDNGDTWEPVNTGLTNTEVYSLAMDSKGYLYAGTTEGGVFRSVASTTSIDKPKDTGKSISFGLKQNYPNPFNSSTKISYSIEYSAFVKLDVYDIQGRVIQTLIYKFQEPGIYSVNFNAIGDASGVYFYKLQVGDYIQKMKMVLLK